MIKMTTEISKAAGVIISLLLSLTLCGCTSGSNTTPSPEANEAPTEIQTVPLTTAPPDTNVYFQPGELPEDYAAAGFASAVWNVSKGHLDHCENYDMHIAPASLTKLLTSLVALKYVSPDTVFTVGDELDFVQEGSSVCYIEYGQSLKLRDLVAGMLISSGNDAAYTVAANIGRIIAPGADDETAISVFVSEMNATAVNYGMNDSHFTTPDGWDNDEQYTTARDLLTLAVKAYFNPVIAEFAAKTSYDAVFESGESITWYSTNQLLASDSPYYNPSCVGLKTGSTSHAGKCLISAFSGEDDYIIVVVGASTDDERYEITSRLFSDFCG